MKSKTGDTLYQTRLALSADTCARVVSRLGTILASLQDFRSQVQFAHWNLKGPNFIALHKHFDDVSDAVARLIDEVAERIVGIGGTANGTLRQSVDRSLLEDMPTDASSAKELIPALADRCAILANECRSAVSIADELGDPVSTDILTQTGRELEKQLFLLASHES